MGTWIDEDGVSGGFLAASARSEQCGTSSPTQPQASSPWYRALKAATPPRTELSQSWGPHLLAQLAEHDLRQICAHAVLRGQLVVAQLLHHVFVLQLDLAHRAAGSRAGGRQQRAGGVKVQEAGPSDGRQQAAGPPAESRHRCMQPHFSPTHLRAMPSHSRELKMPVLSEESLRTRAKRLMLLLAEGSEGQG